MVTVVLPYAGSCPHRAAALGWVMSRYATEHPDWPVFVASAPDGPWSKGAAVNPAVEAAEDGIVIVADADVFCDGLADGVAAVESGEWGWALPHRKVHRLTERATAEVLAGAEPTARMRCTQRPYPGVLGGGIVVARRETLLSCPIDARYSGWGQEDVSHAAALSTLAGDQWRGERPLWHLWHPPQDRMDRRDGSPESVALYDRYRAARGDVEAMRALIAEGTADGQARSGVEPDPLHTKRPPSGLVGRSRPSSLPIKQRA